MDKLIEDNYNSIVNRGLITPYTTDIEFFDKLEKAKEYHAGLKDGSIPRQHSYSLTYANKNVKELSKKLETAKKLWG